MVFLHRGVDRTQLGTGLLESNAGSEAAKQLSHAMDAAGDHRG